MSNEQHPFGNHLILGLHGTTLSEADRAILRRLRPVGLLFFARNFEHGAPYAEWVARFADLLAEVRSLVDRDHLLLSIDHEGGHICRLPAPISKFPYAVQYGQVAEAVGHAMGLELAALGLNVSWAPVADIHSNPLNPVIGVRSFADSVEGVSTSALAYLRGLQAAGIAGCAKHFPGHGDTAIDSHFGLPVQQQSLAQIEQRELKPFKAMIEAGVNLIMTAHILFPAIDAHETVTLSQTFLREVLRARLGYKGVIVSDDLEMAAVRDRFLAGGALSKALSAGNDLFIIARSPNAADVTSLLADEFERAWSANELNSDLLAESRERVWQFVSGLPQPDVQQLAPEVFASHQQLIWEAVGLL